MELNGHKISVASLEVMGVHQWDYPDFSDAFFGYAEYENGIELTESELDELTEKYGDVVHELAHESGVAA
jgi:hypothetical protein